MPRLPPPPCARPASGVGLGPSCYPASLLWSPGPRPSPVFLSALCDCLSLNVSVSEPVSLSHGLAPNVDGDQHAPCPPHKHSSSSCFPGSLSLNVSLSPHRAFSSRTRPRVPTRALHSSSARISRTARTKSSMAPCGPRPAAPLSHTGYGASDRPERVRDGPSERNVQGESHATNHPLAPFPQGGVRCSSSPNIKCMLVSAARRAGRGASV